MTYYSETPQKTNRHAAIFALFCSLVGLALFVFSSFLSYPSAMQAVGVIFLIIAVFLCSRALTFYTYTLQKSEADGLDELCVIEHRGKRNTTLCRLLIRDLQEIHECDRSGEKAVRKAYAGDRIHSYCPDILAAATVYLLFEEDGQRIVLRLQPGRTFMNTLNQLRP